MNQKETRWKQRYNNLIKVFRKLEKANDQFAKLSVLEKEGMIQRFEYACELYWKIIPAF